MHSTLCMKVDHYFLLNSFMVFKNEKYSIRANRAVKVNIHSRGFCSSIDIKISTTESSKCYKFLVFQ